jgi:hypothetical protein
MKRRLAAIAAMSMLALALGAAPVAADEHRGHDGHGGRWTVVQDEVTNLTTLDPALPPVACGSNTYTVISGSVHFRWLMQGTVGSDAIAITDGKGTEDWTMLKVKVVDQGGRVHRVEGRQHVSASWSAGQNVDAGPIDSYRLTVDIHIEGTRDGHHLVARWLPDGSFVIISEKGTCTDLTLFYGN